MGEQPLFLVAAVKDEVGICETQKRKRMSAEDNTGGCILCAFLYSVVTVTFKNGSSSHPTIIPVVYPF